MELWNLELGSTMTDRDALYRAVLDNPDDDTLRLVYADAVEEAGDPRRAAFIRTRVELALLPEYDPGAIQARYHDQKKKVDGGRWITELPPLPDGLSWARDPFRRGLPAAIQARDGAAFVAHADALFDLYPVEWLELADTLLKDTAELAACPWLNRIRHLSLARGTSGPAVRRLLGSEHFERLGSLHIGPQMTTTATVNEIVRSRVFKELTALSVQEDRRGGGAIAGQLANLANPPKLTKLDLSSNRLTAEHLERLVAAPVLGAVEELDLSDNHLGSEGVAVLARAKLPNLRTLHLLRTRPTPGGVSVLVGAEFFRSLRSLSLGGNNLPSPAATWLAGAPAGNLRVLDLRENRLGDRGAETLACSANLSGLLVLDLAESQLGATGADALARSQTLAGLLYLNVYGNALPVDAAARLRKRFGDRVFL
ncbi:MAG: TIGR02996 domain-containing protein [Gemmataceae bacterium]|nr:TIGR02996 domain-containing protein [Gemmataceae bacterium]